MEIRSRRGKYLELLTTCLLTSSRRLGQRKTQEKYAEPVVFAHVIWLCNRLPRTCYIIEWSMSLLCSWLHLQLYCIGTMFLLHFVQGLNDLYDFKLQYPDADLNPFLKTSTQFFQDYIERGLKSIELERQEKQKAMPTQGCWSLLFICSLYLMFVWPSVYTVRNV